MHLQGSQILLVIFIIVMFLLHICQETCACNHGFMNLESLALLLSSFLFEFKILPFEPHMDLIHGRDLHRTRIKQTIPTLFVR